MGLKVLKRVASNLERDVHHMVPNRKMSVPIFKTPD